jgi:prepilin-type processing-associated H-X9-DG protein
MSAFKRAVFTGTADGRRPRRAFTLTDLLVVIVVTALLIVLLAPSLQAAAGRSRTQVCLDNLRMLGLGVRMWADNHDGVLPGPVHPALYQNVEDYFNDEYFWSSYLTWRLHTELGDAFDDRIATCPTMGAINPDRNFTEFHNNTSRRVPPTHYVLNNYGPGTTIRATNPPRYFGNSWPAAEPPRPFGAVPNADREWMIADGWYRPRTNHAFPELQQEGPYQFAWTGEALPNFAPHERRGRRSYAFTSSDDREMQSWGIREAKSDGLTNTLYFDGHAASVPSRTLTFGGWQLLYGFPGTVNPQTPLPAGSVWR